MIIKPDAVQNSQTGKILARIEEEAFRILALAMRSLKREEAEKFYAAHKERPFFDSLLTFMISGPIVAGVLQAPEAVQKWRRLIGDTDPDKAEANTIRRLYAQSKEKNAVHGSDSPENAKVEIQFFFPDMAL